MRCAEVMRTDVHCLRQEADARTAAKMMDELGVALLPVCDARARLVGTVTAFELATRVCSTDGRPSGCRVLDVMSTSVAACHPGDDVQVAGELMSELHEPRVFVVDQDDVVQGIITPDEIAAAARPETAS